MRKLYFVVIIVLAALSLPVNLSAQEQGGGLFGLGEKDVEQQREGLLRGGSIVYSSGAYNNLGNQPFGVEPNNYAPLHGGLFILLAAGAGYALVKSRRRRRVSLLLALPIMLLGLTQCNKDKVVPETPVLEGEKYHISLTLGGGSQTRADVYPDDARDIAPVYYEKDVDKLLVVYKGAFVGEITCKATHDYHPDDPDYPNNYYDASADFEGDITITDSDVIDNTAPLYFYYVGNFTYTVSGSNIIVNTSDQRSRLPVISFAASKEAFKGNGTYTVYNGYNGDGHHWLLNQCALVKFECENIYDMSPNTNDNNSYAIYKTTKDITIYGMDNKVTISMNSTLNSPSFTWSREGSGAIMLHTRPQDAAVVGWDGSVRYAIVNHDQSDLASITAGELNVPFDPATDPYGFFGTYKIAHDVVKNEYFDGGKIDLVWHSGAFKVATVPDTLNSSANNDADPSDLHLNTSDYSSPFYIVFSRGNLQYNYNQNKWRFAKHQYDYVGGGVPLANTRYLGTVVLNENDGTSPSMSGNSSANRSDNEQISDNDGNYTGYTGWIDLYGWGTGDNPMKSRKGNSFYADWHEWGDHPVFNDGTKESSSFWFTLRRDEWQWLLENRDNYANKVGFATVNGVKGMILLPEIWPGQPSGCPAWESAGAHIEDQSWSKSYTEEQWRKMELQGAVFLPAAGYRGAMGGSLECNIGYDCGTWDANGPEQNWGAYWSSTKATKVTNASSFYMRFGQGIVGDHVNPGYYMAPDNGNAVRLVHRVGSSSKFGFTKKD